MKVSIVGGGATGLFCAYHLVKNNIQVEIFEKESSVGRKLLVAGKSGLNITSNLDPIKFPDMYFEHSSFFKKTLSSFNSQSTISWMKELGIDHFVGSSHKVFPKSFKAADLIKKIKFFLERSGLCEIHLKSSLIDFSHDELVFESHRSNYERAIFCFGGASWVDTGSDGKWLNLFRDKSIQTKCFKPSNCGFVTRLKASKRIPLKNIAMSFNNETVKGESLLTPDGIEGGVLYYFSSKIRDEIIEKGESFVGIDFLPNLSLDSIFSKLSSIPSKVSWSNKLKKVLNLDKDILSFLKLSVTKETYTNPELFIRSVKNFELHISKSFDIDKAISTAGGVCFEELNKNLTLKAFDHIYLGGEMLDWEAPTGGYLLQACFSMGNFIVEDIKKADQVIGY